MSSNLVMLENYRSVRGNSTPKIAKLIDLVQILMGQEFGERGDYDESEGVGQLII